MPLQSVPIPALVTDSAPRATLALATLDGTAVLRTVLQVSSTNYHPVPCMVAVLSYYYLHCFVDSAGECPKGPAWADKALAEDTAHQSAECSNAGVCDRKTGSCSCYDGFTGSACQRSMHSLRQTADFFDSD
jgi:hypothetical protein